MIGGRRRGVFFRSSGNWCRAWSGFRILDSLYGPCEIFAKVVIEEQCRIQHCVVQPGGCRRSDRQVGSFSWRRAVLMWILDVLCHAWLAIRAFLSCKHCQILSRKASVGIFMVHAPGPSDG